MYQILLTSHKRPYPFGGEGVGGLAGEGPGGEGGMRGESVIGL